MSGKSRSQLSDGIVDLDWFLLCFADLDAILLQSNPPLRQRRQRTNFNDDALNSLEEAFAKNPYPDINERETIALQLKTTEDRVQVWFQNKRARYRKRVQKDQNAEEQSVKSDRGTELLISKKPGPRPSKTTMSRSPLTTAPLGVAPSSTYRFQDSCYLNSTPHSDSAYGSFQSTPSSSSFNTASPQLWQSFFDSRLHAARIQSCFNVSSPITPEAGFSLGQREFASSSPFIYNLADLSNQSQVVKKPRVAKSIFKPYEWWTLLFSFSIF